MVAELVEPLPVDGEMQRRGRGRPPKLNPDGTRVNPPKVSRPSRPKRVARATGKPRSRSLAPEISAFLTMVNSVILLTPIGTRPMEASPMLSMVGGAATEPPTKIGDELDSAEIKMLAASIDRQCQRSPRFRKYVERVLGAGSGGMLVGTLGMIAARRASRHGILPKMIDPAIGILMESGDLNALASMMTVPTPSATPDETTHEIEPDRSEPIDFENIGTFAEA